VVKAADDAIAKAASPGRPRCWSPSITAKEKTEWMEYGLVLGPPGSLACNWSWVRITLATGPECWEGGTMGGRMPRERKSWNNSWVCMTSGFLQSLVYSSVGWVRTGNSQFQ
jgi:hypothetical protein